MTACAKCGKDGAKPCESRSALEGRDVPLCNPCDLAFHRELRRALASGIPPAAGA